MTTTIDRGTRSSWRAPGVHRRLAGPPSLRGRVHERPGGRPEAAGRLVPGASRRRERGDRPQVARRVPRGRGRRRTRLQPRVRHGRHGVHRGEQGRLHDLGADQHAPVDGGEGRRPPAVLLRVVGVHLQHRAPARRGRDRAPRGGRVPGAARGRVRLGEALLGAHVSALSGRLRHQHARGAISQRLRTARHLRRGPREGAGRDLPQGRAGTAHGQQRDRDLGRRRADAQLHVHRRLPPWHDTHHGERHPRPDQPRARRSS